MYVRWSSYGYKILQRGWVSQPRHLFIRRRMIIEVRSDAQFILTWSIDVGLGLAPLRWSVLVDQGLSSLPSVEGTGQIMSLFPLSIKNCAGTNSKKSGLTITAAPLERDTLYQICAPSSGALSSYTHLVFSLNHSSSGALSRHEASSKRRSLIT